MAEKTEVEILRASLSDALRMTRLSLRPLALPAAAGRKPADGLRWHRWAVCAILLCHGRARAEYDAEKIQGLDGKRNSGDRHRRGRGRRADLRGVCGCTAGRISVHRSNVRGDARRRGGTPRSVDRDVPAAIRGPHSAHPSGKRERVPAEETGVAGAPARRERGPEASGIDGDGGGAILRASREQDDGRINPGIAEQAGG